MGEVFTGWQNRNENRDFPLNDRATRLAVSGVKLPNDILADAHFALPRSAGKFVFVSSVGISEHLVSLTLLATADDPIGGGVPSSFVPMGVMTLQKPVIPYRGYPISPLYPGFGGWLAFGNGAGETNSLSLQFDDPKATVMAAKAVHAYNDLPVKSLGSTENSLELTGLIHMQGQAGLVKVYKAIREIDGVDREVLAIGLDIEGAADPVELLLRYTGQCGRPEQRTCPTGKALLTINGVEPDCNGNIRIRVAGLDAVITGITAEQLAKLVASGNVIDLPVGLEDICPVLDPLRIFDADLCFSSSSSLSSSSESSESSLSSSSVSSSSPEPVTGSYCDTFESPATTFANLKPKLGSWGVAVVTREKESTGRLISGRGILGPQVILHDRLDKDPAEDPYRIEATIRARTENGGGHVIFGYKNPDDFWVAGFVLRPQSDVNGLLYVGRKTVQRSTILDNWPNGLDYGYFFVQEITPTEDSGAGGPGGGAAPPFNTNGLFNTDIRVVVDVAPVAPGSPINLVQVGFEWDATHAFLVPSGSQFANIIFSVSPADSDLRGFAGMGTVGSETEFDDFGIDCPDWSSSSVAPPGP